MKVRVNCTRAMEGFEEFLRKSEDYDESFVRILKVRDLKCRI